MQVFFVMLHNFFHKMYNKFRALKLYTIRNIENFAKFCNYAIEIHFFV